MAPRQNPVSARPDRRPRPSRSESATSRISCARAGSTKVRRRRSPCPYSKVACARWRHSKLVAHAGARRSGWITLDPIGWGVVIKVKVHEVLAAQAHDEARRHDNGEE